MPWNGALHEIGRSLRGLVHSEKSDLYDELCKKAAEDFEQYLETYDPNALHSSIASLDQARDLIDKRPSLLTTKRQNSATESLHSVLRFKAQQLRLLFQETDQTLYLDQSIDLLQTLYKHSQKSTSDKFAEAISLAQHLSDRYFLKLESNHVDLQAAVDASHFAISIPDALQNPVLEANEAELRCLDVARLLAKELFHVVKGIYSYEWGQVLQRRGAKQQDTSIFKTALKYHTQAMRLLPPSHPLYIANAVQLASCEGNLIKHSSDISRLDATLTLLSQIKLDSVSTEIHVKLKTTMSDLFRGKFDHLSTIEDLDRAIKVANEAITLSNTNTKLQVLALKTLSNQLAKRASLQCSRLDIDLAVESAQRVVVLVSKSDNISLSGAYKDLGALLGVKFSMFRKIENLKISIKYLRLALDLLPQDHALCARTLHALCLGLRDEFYHTSNISALDEAIEIERKALAAFQEPSIDNLVILDQLSSMLEDRYQGKGNSQDLQESIKHAETALAGASKSSQQYPTYLNGLSTRLTSRFRRYSRSEDLDRAIELASEAITRAGDDQQGILYFKSHLASCLEQRFHLTRDLKDIDNAIDLMRNVVAGSAVPQPRWLCELALCLYARIPETVSFEGKREFLNESVSYQNQAIASQSKTDPKQAWYLYLLGNLNMVYVDLLPDSQDAKLSRDAIYSQCVDIYEKAFVFQQTTPISRITIAKSAGMCYMFLGYWKRASEILSESVLLFPRISPLALDQDDRQRKLGSITEQSTWACFACVRLKQPARGVEILDAGRGIMGKLAIRQHDRLPLLKALDVSLHERYIKLRETLSVPISDSNNRGQDLIAQRQKDQVSFEDTENDIRQLPGMENFNKNLSASEIQELARDGPLVSFCETGTEIFALIVTQVDVQALKLSGLERSEIDKRIPLIIGSNRLSLWPPSKRAMAVKKMRALLGWLWDVVIKPVLSHLNLLNTEKAVLPRIWWVTSGHLGLMPLHAAGKGTRGKMENAHDHVISSYVSTCAALAFARECQAKVAEGPPNVTLVSMPNTPGNVALQTADEEQAVRKAFSITELKQGSRQLTELIQPSAVQVLNAVRDNSTDIFHFCCHIKPNLADPSRTALLFGQDPAASSPDRLTISQLREYNSSDDLDSKAPQLAYLSGCCTAQQYDLRLLDESIHLASIFQLIGFPAVIGTLWEADDKAAVFIARVFYDELIRLKASSKKLEQGVSTADHIARALHTAVAACRATKFGKVSGAEDVLLWANFVHFGA